MKFIRNYILKPKKKVAFEGSQAVCRADIKAKALFLIRWRHATTFATTANWGEQKESLISKN